MRTRTVVPFVLAFAAAGKAFDAAVQGEGWKSIPLADVDQAEALLGDASRVRKGVEQAKAHLAKAGAEIKALAPDRAVVRIDDQMALAYDAEGKTLGLLEGEFEPQADGTLMYALGGFEAMPAR